MRTVGETALMIVSAVLVALFVLLMIGGSVYRTDCFLPAGRVSHGWELTEGLMAERHIVTWLVR